MVRLLSCVTWPARGFSSVPLSYASLVIWAIGHFFVTLETVGKANGPLGLLEDALLQSRSPDKSRCVYAMRRDGNSSWRERGQGNSVS